MSHLRTHLGGVTVDGLTTTDNDVNITNFLDGSGQRIRGGQRISTGKQTVGQQPACVGTAIESLADNLTSTRRTHGEHSNSRARMLLFQAQRLLQGIQIFGVEDSGQSSTVDSTFGCHRVLAHISCVGYLLGKYNNL